MDVHIDPLAPAPRLYVIGAGHVGFHLARAAADAGFQVDVVDDREKFAERGALSRGRESSSSRSPTGWRGADIPAAAYVVIVTRGHQHDLDAVRALAPRELRYLGLIGSRAKVARIYDALGEEGFPPERLARVHAPIGLDIGAVTPAEIAISILAELIAVRRGADVAALAMKRL